MYMTYLSGDFEIAIHDRVGVSDNLHDIVWITCRWWRSAGVIMNQLRLIFCNQKDLAKVLGWCKSKFPWRRSYHILDHGKTQMYLLDVTGDSKELYRRISVYACENVLVTCRTKNFMHFSFSVPLFLCFCFLSWLNDD